MSAAPKRGPHEEGVQSSSSSMRPNFGIIEEEEPSVFSRLSYGQIQDSRGLLPRPESRDGERRSPLHSLYRMPPPSMTMTDSPHPSHPIVGPEIRVESRDPKENKGVETSRDVKVESREGHHQSGKVEKEARVESRGDESKEVKHERDTRNDSKSEPKVEKDVHGVMGSHPNWKDQHRFKRHPDVPSGGSGILGPWGGSPQVRPKYEAPKEVGVSNITKERVEANEAVGENRIDPRVDDKYKDRRRKEGKHHDWPENDKDRSDSRSNLQVGSSSNDYKEPTKEEKESDRWERERKDVQKEKERMKEREKDQVDREAQNGGDKEGYHHEKEVAEKASAPENFASEQKKPKELDAWKNVDREGKERRKERDGDVEGERPEKRSKCYDKESDEGGTEADGGTDREREAFSYGVQQRKRMLRPRGSPQLANRDGRFKARAQDAEGSQGMLSCRSQNLLKMVPFPVKVHCICDTMLLLIASFSHYDL